MNAFRPVLTVPGNTARPALGWLLAFVSLQWTALLVAVGFARSPSPAIADTSQREAPPLKASPTPIDHSTANGAESTIAPLPGATPASPLTTAPNTTFHAAVHLGARWFVLHHVVPSEATRPPAPMEAVLLTGGQVLFMQDDRDPLYDQYTLVNGRSTCHTRAIRRVVVALDSGEPTPNSALGPTWVADQVSACELRAPASIPVVALSGAPAVKIARGAEALPQRVRVAPSGETLCELGGYDHDFAFEIGSAHYEVVRTSNDPDKVLVRRDDPDATGPVLDARASLYWDDAGLDC